MADSKSCSVPASLVQHLKNKVAESIEAVKTSDVDVTALTNNVIDAMIGDAMFNLSNKRFLECGIAISKCLRVYPDLINGLVDKTNVNISSLLQKYDHYIAANNSIFSNIQGHHNHIGTLDWTEAAANEADLATYSTAAEKMGDRQWVQAGNDWMRQFSIQFFRDGGAKKHYMRILRENYLAEHGVEWPNDDSLKCNNSLSRNLLDGSGNQLIRLLDVGSCYNPFAADTPENSSLDVTALDLYPAHPSVLQCDFLNLSVGSPGSAPVTVAPINSASSSSSASRADNETGGALDPSLMTRLLQLPFAGYDVITMSLVLNYLPSPLHREIMIAKARQLLIGPNHNGQPHHRGLLLIVEKHSIFGKDSVDRPDLYCAGKGALLKNFKQSICNLGFELVKYREMEPVNNIRSHLFAFATMDVSTDVLNQQCERLSALLRQEGAASHLNMRGEDGQLLPRLWIKQDFDAALYGRETDKSTEKGSEAAETKNRKREREEEGNM